MFLVATFFDNYDNRYEQVYLEPFWIDKETEQEERRFPAHATLNITVIINTYIAAV